MSEPKKLSERDLEVYRSVAEANPESSVARLFNHIAAMEAEQQRVASRTANDQFEVGHANATFIEQQTKRIETLEKLVLDAELALQPFADCEALSEEKCNRALRALWEIKKFREGKE